MHQFIDISPDGGYIDVEYLVNGLVIATEKFWSVRLKSLKFKAFLGVLIDKSTIASTCSTVPI
jgi:hypothetical protein